MAHTNAPPSVVGLPPVGGDSRARAGPDITTCPCRLARRKETDRAIRDSIQGQTGGRARALREAVWARFLVSRKGQVQPGWSPAVAVSTILATVCVDSARATHCNIDPKPRK